MNSYIQVILIYMVILILSPKRYLSILPTIPIYPNNYEESLIVQEISENRTMSDILFFKKTDEKVSPAFEPYVNETIEELDKIFLDFTIHYSILFYKYTINRARPYQINPKIKILKSETGNTPSFPAGHAMQAYYLAKYLSEKYPSKRTLLFTIAKKCDECRIKAGIHYPSDGHYSRYLLNL